MQMEEERGTARSSTKPCEPEAAVAGLDRLTAGFAADIAFGAIGAQLSKLLRLSECPAAQWDDTVQIRCMGCRMVFPSGVQSSC